MFLMKYTILSMFYIFYILVSLIKTFIIVIYAFKCVIKKASFDPSKETKPKFKIENCMLGLIEIIRRQHPSSPCSGLRNILFSALYLDVTLIKKQGYKETYYMSLRYAQVKQKACVNNVLVRIDFLFSFNLTIIRPLYIFLFNLYHF